MGEIRIRLRGNIRTGKKDILVEYDSDEDLTRLEHERRHRDIVEQLLGQGLVTLDELGELRVERVGAGEPGLSAGEEWPEEEWEAEAEG